MKAEINEYGSLEISAENPLEAYALNAWVENNKKMFTDPVGLAIKTSFTKNEVKNEFSCIRKNIGNKQKCIYCGIIKLKQQRI